MPDPAMPPSSPSPKMLLAMIFGGMMLWGLYIAAGVLWYGVNPRGALIVLLCVGFFLGFWWLLLRTQKRRK